jgi:hypothetical protein
MRKISLEIISFLLLLIASISVVNAQKVIKEKDKVAYLFVYFTGNNVEEESIHFAISKDGYNYLALNDNKPVLDSKLISSTGGVRDPHILRGEDGHTFYMVVTDMTSCKGWNSNRAMVLMKSKDLVNWTSTNINIQKKYPGNDDLLRVWAPQTIFDKKAGKYMIYWAMKNGDNPDKIYYAYANSDFTDFEGVPRQLFFPSNGKSCIDADIIQKDSVYHLFYKTEGDGNGIKQATSTSLTSGKWIEKEEYMQPIKDPVEGSCVFKLSNSNNYILMYDMYTKGSYQFTQSSTLDSFTIVDNKISMNFHPRHGTVMSITKKELNKLINKWSLPENYKK